MLFREKLTDRLLTMLGIDLDVTLAVQRKLLSEITPTLFVGSKPSIEDVAALKEVGITHVVSCLAEGLRTEMSFLADDFQYLFLPLRDSIDEDIFSQFPQVFDFAESVVKKEVGAKVLIHCEAGVSRSASMAIAVLMQSHRKRFIEAYIQARAGRPEVLPNIGFATQLQQLEHDLFPDQQSARQQSSLTEYLCQFCNVPTDRGMLQQALERNDYDSARAIRAIFGDEIPRVVQGVRV